MFRNGVSGGRVCEDNRPPDVLKKGVFFRKGMPDIICQGGKKKNNRRLAVIVSIGGIHKDSAGCALPDKGRRA